MIPANAPGLQTGDLFTGAGFVLAGGQSSRMGTDKALLNYRGEALVAAALRKLRQVTAEAAIAGGDPALARFGRLIPDLAPGMGPLGGIVAGLRQSGHEWNLFVPVDLPDFPASAMRALCAAAAAGGAATTVARCDGQVHPLCAVIARRALPVLEAQLEAGNLRVRAAFEAAGPVAYWQCPDPDWLRNANTPADFAALTHPTSVRG